MSMSFDHSRRLACDVVARFLNADISADPRVTSAEAAYLVGLEMVGEDVANIATGEAENRWLHWRMKFDERERATPILHGREPRARKWVA
jgi:hypothetical protein